VTTVPEKYNLSTMLDANLTAGRTGKVAIIYEDEQITYGELFDRVCRMGRALRSLGVRNGERVMLVLGDTPILPVAFFGALRIGAVPCLLNPHFNEDDYRSFVEDALASVVVTDAAHCDKLSRSLAKYHSAVTIIAPVRTSDSNISLDEILSVEDGTLSPVNTHRDDMAFWLYSGGSTGRPKAVMHTHQDVPWTCETYARHVLGIQENDISFARALFHAYGLGGGLTFPLWVGATSILYPDRPTPAGLLEIIRQHRPSLLFLVPTLYNAIVNDPASASSDVSSLRRCISAAEPLPPEIWRRWRDMFGLEILDGVGSTEVLHIFCSNTLDAIKPGSSGKAVPGYKLRLVDEAGIPMAPGNVGILQVSGQSTSMGYWRQRVTTQQSMIGEWVSTGDRFRLDDEGFYWYEGRADDMIKIGGEWVSPIEIENAIRGHPVVIDAAVTSVPIDNLMRIRAAIVLAPGHLGSTSLTRELQEWCKAHLQRYKYPHLVDFVDTLPRTTTGKVQRFKLREVPIDSSTSSGVMS
jgi:benzoate-CoA ligase family protein